MAQSKSLAPQNEEQRSLKAAGVGHSIELVSHSGFCRTSRPRSSRPFWLLWSFGSPSFFLASAYLHRQTRTVVAAMFIVALTVSSALFLILELDRPFNGVIMVSSEPLRNVLSHLGR